MSHLHHDQVAEFHRVFGHPIHDLPTAPSFAWLTLRRDLLDEEHKELHAALTHDDKPGTADAYVDTAYIAHGSLHAYGLPYSPVDRFDDISLDAAVRAHLVADTLARLHYTLLAICAKTRAEAAALGIPFDAVWDAVHTANMAKVWPDGTVHYREDGKVLKPPNWSPPDIAAVLAAHRGDR